MVVTTLQQIFSEVVEEVSFKPQSDNAGVRAPEQFGIRLQTDHIIISLKYPAGSVRKPNVRVELRAAGRVHRLWHTFASIETTTKRVPFLIRLRRCLDHF